MKFGDCQLAAIIKVANAMVMADGEIAEQETNVIKKELENLHIPQSRIKKASGDSSVMKPINAVTIVSRFNDEKKKFMTSFLVNIMLADGEINENELMLLQFLLRLCDLSKEDVHALIKDNLVTPPPPLIK